MESRHLMCSLYNLCPWHDIVMPYACQFSYHYSQGWRWEKCMGWIQRLEFSYCGFQIQAHCAQRIWWSNRLARLCHDRCIWGLSYMWNSALHHREITTNCVEKCKYMWSTVTTKSKMAFMITHSVHVSDCVSRGKWIDPLIGIYTVYMPTQTHQWQRNQSGLSSGDVWPCRHTMELQKQVWRGKSECKAVCVMNSMQQVMKSCIEPARVICLINVILCWALYLLWSMEASSQNYGMLATRLLKKYKQTVILRINFVTSKSTIILKSSIAGFLVLTSSSLKGFFHCLMGANIYDMHTIHNITEPAHSAATWGKKHNNR